MVCLRLVAFVATPHPLSLRMLSNKGVGVSRDVHWWFAIVTSRQSGMTGLSPRVDRQRWYWLFGRRRLLVMSSLEGRDFHF